jgi:glycerophosphoryl diester phosphodiesterase
VREPLQGVAAHGQWLVLPRPICYRRVRPTTGRVADMRDAEAHGVQGGRRPYVVGHRGCAGILPENTLAGFRHAIALGVDLVECDVHLTRDEQLVVIHDERVDRTTDGTGEVRRLSLAEVRALDAGRGERVPTLQEVLEVVARGGVGLLLELKGEGTAGPALAAVRARGLLPAVTFTCFELGRLEEVRRLEPAARTGAIFPRGGPEVADLAASVGASGLGIQFRSLTPDILDRAHALGLEVRAWNPDEEEDLRAVLALGPDGISTNRPDRLLDLLGRPRRT